jgi:MraZ protein
MSVALSFISRWTSKLDNKGRVCVPAQFRQILAAQNTPGIYLCPSFHEAAIEGFGEEVLQKFHRMQAELDPFFAPQHDDRALAVLAMTECLPLDENGRVRLPDEMIAHAGLKETVVFVGMGTRFQLWEPDSFKPVLARGIDNVRTQRNASKNGGGG